MGRPGRPVDDDPVRPTRATAPFNLSDSQAGPSPRKPLLCRSQANLTATVLVLAVPPAIWWLVGDLSEVDGSSNPEQAYYMFEPFDVSDGVARACGLAATLFVGLSVVVLALATNRRVLDGRWWRSVAPLLLAGAFVGCAWRVVTAAVHGANIGGGMVLLFGLVFVPAMLVWSVLSWAAARAARRGHGRVASRRAIAAR